VVSGIMYVTNPNECIALDAGTGRMIWQFKRPRTIGITAETVNKDQSTLEMVAYRDMWGKGTDSYLHMMFEVAVSCFPNNALLRDPGVKRREQIRQLTYDWRLQRRN